MATIHSVPNEILARTLSYVNAHDFEAFASTCVRFDAISTVRMKQHIAWKKSLQSVSVNSAEECQELVVQAVFEDRGYYIEKLLFNDQQGFEFFDSGHEPDDTIYRQVLDTLPHVPSTLKDTLCGYLDTPDNFDKPMLATLLLALPNLQHISLRPGVFLNRPLCDVLRWAAFNTSQPGNFSDKTSR